MSDNSEQKIKEKSVEVVNDDVEDFVMPGCDPLNHFVLKPETECC